MKPMLSRALALVAALAGLAAVAAPAVHAVPVSVDITNLRAIRVYHLDPEGTDDVYVQVGGIAKGADVTARFPQEGSAKAAPKTPPITDAAPAVAWAGDLADGEFAFLTVALYHGTGADAAPVKAFTDKLDAAGKGVAERAKKTLTADDAKKLATATVKVQAAVVAKVGETLSRAKKTDHFGGLFNVLVRNQGGKIIKRLDPVGLTFGEDAGLDVKTYTKIKNTLPNVLLKEGGEWSQQQVLPLSDDEMTLRVKMLDTQMVADRKHVTDYLADVQVKADGKPQIWKLGGEELGKSDIHTYYRFAE